MDDHREGNTGEGSSTPSQPPVPLPAQVINSKNVTLLPAEEHHLELPLGHTHELQAPASTKPAKPDIVAAPMKDVAAVKAAMTDESLPPLLRVERKPAPAPLPPTSPVPKVSLPPLMPEIVREEIKSAPAAVQASTVPSLSDEINKIVRATEAAPADPFVPRPLSPLPGQATPTQKNTAPAAGHDFVTLQTPSLVKPSGLTPAQDQSIPEPVILNETIIPKKTASVAPQPELKTEMEKPFAPPRNTDTPNETVVPNTQSPKKDTALDVSFAPLPLRREEGTPPETSEPVKKGFFDVSSILKGIKLPERYTAKVTGESKPLMPNVPKVEQKPEAPFVPKLVPKPPIPPQQTPPPNTPLTPSADVSVGGAQEQKKESTGETVENVSGGTVTRMRTFKEDMMHIVRDRKISVVKAVALEEDKKSKIKQPTPAEIQMHRQRRRRAFAILFTVGILTFLGAAALYGVYTIEQQRTALPKMPANQGMIFAEQSLSFPLQDLSSGEIKRVLAQSRGSSNAALGSITRVVPTLPILNEAGQTLGVRGATLGEFLESIGSTAPETLLRAIDSEFFFGIHTVDENAPLIIVRVLSYEHAFAGMLEWEKAMNTDLAPAFTALPSFMTGENGLPEQRTFYDVVMRNYDVRAMKDELGQIQLYYSFPTPKILIIAESTYSFTEILTRLQAARNL